MTGMISVGGFTEPIEKATRLVREYVTEYGRWSYPAYDGYLRDTPTLDVRQQDLLAAALLNAGQQPIPTYYGLLEILPEINRRLEDPRLTGTLEEASGDTLDAIADLYGILDDHPQHQVQLVKLSKVLHRKRPELLPLYDKNVWRCYSQIGNPVRVEPVKRRSDRKRMQAWLPQVQADLKRASILWRDLAALASKPTITPLRALDILAWRLVDEVTPRQKRQRVSFEKKI
ncbi:hypothetical protein QFZ36_004182 [Pseudarthrobacter siccitolerans]|uniref:Uncharacterized protein n=1 Tax=Pseudarthrobacter siccitolerans TaxID=861266 RepID=A0ABU0PRF4_9MICC|nr:DUF6308 family protein [Pseudarthrobacter siccitolerans]MDQ0676556.1 hypothetical protein [Pseudarthrobacter siccitolerans]